MDVLVLGPALPRGTVIRARPIGVLRLLDDGELDDKILAVQTAGPLSDVSDLDEMEARHPGALSIVDTWLQGYKGPGRIESRGIEDAKTARAIVREASQYFENQAKKPQNH